MTITAQPDSADHAGAEHPGNRQQTGSVLFQVADFVETISHTWKEHDQVHVLVLRALCRLARASERAAIDGCTAYDLVLAARVERPQWPEPSDKNDASRRIAKHWTAVGLLLDAKREHLETQLRDAGISETPKLHKDQGGGQGLTSRYRLLTEPLPPAEAVDVPIRAGLDHQALTSAPNERAATEVRYAPEDSARHGSLTARLAAGIEISGWARRSFIAAIVLLTVIAVGSSLLPIFAVLLVPKPEVWLGLTLATAMVLAVIWVVALPPFRVVHDRILKAPFWLQGGDDLWLLEWRCPPLHPRKSMHRVRYSGTCPLCRGRVDVDAQAWFLPADRLIGRCENAPAAHRYSFDHVTRRGRPL